MFNVFLIVTSLSLAFCLYFIIICLIAVSSECELPDLDDIEEQ